MSSRNDVDSSSRHTYYGVGSKNAVVKMFKTSVTQYNTRILNSCVPIYNMKKTMCEIKNCSNGHEKSKISWSVLHYFNLFTKFKVLHCEEKHLEATKTRQKTYFHQYGNMEKEIEQFIETETARQRVIRLLTPNMQTGKYTPEFLMMLTTAKMLGVMFFLVGFFKEGIEAREAFKKRNQITKYMAQRRAQKQFFNATIKGGLKGGMRWCLRGIGVSSIGITTTLLNVYRNKLSPFHLAIGAALYGSVVKISLGPKGMFSGGVIAGTIGLGAGTLLYIVMVYGLDLSQEKANYESVEAIIWQKWENRGLVARRDMNDSDDVDME